MLAIRGLNVSYGGSAVALHGVDMTVPAGSLVAVLGSNGAGKTTLLRAVSNSLGAFGGSTDSGSIQWNGHELANLKPDRIVRLGVVQAPEGRGIFGALTVEENLRVGAFTRRRSEISASMDEALTLFEDLRPRLKTKAGLLSGGQQQMLALGRALMAKPQLLLLDEPSLGLAPKLVDAVAEAILRIKESGTTVALVEQNAAMAMEMAEHVYVLENGRVSLNGPASELQASDEVRRLYLGLDAEDEIEHVAGAGGQTT